MPGTLKEWRRVHKSEGKEEFRYNIERKGQKENYKFSPTRGIRAHHLLLPGHVHYHCAMGEPQMVL